MFCNQLSYLIVSVTSFCTQTDTDWRNIDLIFVYVLVSWIILKPVSLICILSVLFVNFLRPFWKNWKAMNLQNWELRHRRSRDQEDKTWSLQGSDVSVIVCKLVSVNCNADRAALIDSLYTVNQHLLCCWSKVQDDTWLVICPSSVHTWPLRGLQAFLCALFHQLTHWASKG